MLRLSTIQLFIIGSFLIVAVQSRICSKEVVKTRPVVEPVSILSNGRHSMDENEVTPKTLSKSRRRHENVTHTITYCCREEDDTEISIKECVKECKANCFLGECKKGRCKCSYGFKLVNNGCVSYCDLCRESNGTCDALILCRCKSGSYLRQPCPIPDEYPKTTTENFGDFGDTDEDVAFMRNLWTKLNNGSIPSGSEIVLDDYDRFGGSNHTNNSTEPSTTIVPMNTTIAQSHNETTERTTTPSLNITRDTSEQSTAAKDVAPISTEDAVTGQSNSTDLKQGSATFKFQQNGVSILIAIIFGNHTCG
ncbi:hypothetical protein B5X24_HaOG212208 [Helicoverpa armigera]|nr:hypothetical protein B5X24_HaOG212208 [Helicoverpa armigera]